MADVLSLASAAREQFFLGNLPRPDSKVAPTRSRLARLLIAWNRRRIIRAELRALDESQMRDAGITADALADALRRPLSCYMPEPDGAAPSARAIRGWSFPAITVLSLAGVVGCAPPTLADHRSRQAYAAVDLSLFSRTLAASLDIPVRPPRPEESRHSDRNSGRGTDRGRERSNATP